MVGIFRVGEKMNKTLWALATSVIGVLLSFPVLAGSRIPSDAASRMVISLPVTASDFEINDGIPGSGDIECGSSKTSPGWIVGQWANEAEHSLCNATASVPAVSGSCPGADWERKSETLRVCYWGGNKKVSITLNANKMDYGGCCVYCSEERRRHPGGYGVKFSWNAKRAGVFDNKLLELRNLQRLTMKVGIATPHYQEYPCPPDTPKPVKAPKTPNNPVAHAVLYLFLTDPDQVSPNGRRTVLIGANLWDSRAGWSRPKKAFINCDFPSGNKKWVVVTQPVTAFKTRDGKGNQVPEPDNAISKKAHHYEWDLLPEIDEMLNRCSAEGSDYSDMKIIGAYFGNEVYNGVSVTNEFFDPQIILEAK